MKGVNKISGGEKKSWIVLVCCLPEIILIHLGWSLRVAATEATQRRATETSPLTAKINHAHYLALGPTSCAIDDRLRPQKQFQS
jgi:hypothetical protein